MIARKILKNMAKIGIRNQYRFTKKAESIRVQELQKPQGFSILKFLKDGWNQTFPDQQSSIKMKYDKYKSIKRYTNQQIQQMQQKIPQYQRTALVQTQQIKQQKKKFKISNIIPNSLKNKIFQTHTYKQYSEFKQNLNQFVQTSNSAAVQLGSKVYNIATQPSNAEKAALYLKKYDREFNIMELQSQSKYIFKNAYQQFLKQDCFKLQMMCGQQALDMFKSLIKMNTAKNIRPKYSQILHQNESQLKKTIYSEQTQPSFVFKMNIMQIYCMIDKQGKVVDGDDQRILSSTFQFVLKYDGQHVQQLGHPWQITQFRKIDQVKLLV